MGLRRRGSRAGAALIATLGQQRCDRVLLWHRNTSAQPGTCRRRRGRRLLFRLHRQVERRFIRRRAGLPNQRTDIQGQRFAVDRLAPGLCPVVDVVVFVAGQTEQLDGGGGGGLGSRVSVVRGFLC